jgi:septum formation protein
MISKLDGGIYLASRSPRRQELLAQIGVTFEVVEADVDESVLDNESPRAYVERLARAKAEAGWQQVERTHRPPAPVLGADTTVTVDGRILAKPADGREAAEMLAALSGRLHEVLTAVALKLGPRLESAVSVSEVRFKELSAEEIASYIATGECDDKAGAYGIQGHAGVFVKHINGSYTGVMGLPLYETVELLKLFGYPAP